MQAYYDNKPSYLEAVGNGSYIYRWDIEELTPVDKERASQWKCQEVTVWGLITSSKVIDAVIRSQYTAEQELSLVNKFNAYQQGLDIAPDIVTEYSEYLSFVANVKRNVRKDFGETVKIITDANPTPRLSDLFTVLALSVNTFHISDEDSLRVKSLYPKWETLIGKEVTKDFKLLYDNRLWKVLQPHTVQAEFKPGPETASLFTEIVEMNAGTIDDPIPYNGNMVLENGKHYIQGGTIYKCIRDTVNPVYNSLVDLLGIYVEQAI